MLKFGSLALTLMLAVAPAAIAQVVDTAASRAADPAAARKGRVLTQQGRVFDPSATAESMLVDPRGVRVDGNSPRSDQARTMRNPTVTQGLKVSREISPGTIPGQAEASAGVDPLALKGAPVTGSPHEMPDSTVQIRHDLSKGSIGNVKAREAAFGIPGGPLRQESGTPGFAVRETALRGPDAPSRDKSKGTPKTGMPLAADETVPDVDVSMPNIGQPTSR